MITADSSITIYNQYDDPETRMTKWNRTVLHGISAFVNTKASLVNGEGRPANESVFRIPSACDKYSLYMPEYDYHCATHKENFWTLAIGDLIVAGVCQIEDIGGISTLEKNHFKAFRVCAVSDNRRGILEPHLKVRCE